MKFFAGLFCCVAAAGCATTSTVEPTTTTVTTMTSEQAKIVRRPAPQKKSLDVSAPVFADGDDYAYVDGATGKQISFDDVVARLRVSKVIVVGEQHDQRSHHELQRRVVQVLAGDGPGLVVGLEMLTFDKQKELDRFNRGDLDADGLRLAVDWKKAWGFDFGLYAPIFDAGHKGGARFVALNAPRELVRAVRTKGIEGLSDDEKSRLPDLDLGDELHRAWFERIFSSAGHPLKEAEFQGFYRAQVTWDETMAQGVADAVTAGARQVVVLAGAGHVANGRGIPQRVERRLGGRVLSVVPLAGVDSDNAKDSIERAVQAGEGDVLVVPRFEPEISL